ncbi:MAG: hypothetical protein CMK59_07255 [Proteobacteria bacterium]|nr:hypothetical protein [Pseudomonadota bacterium]
MLNYKQPFVSAVIFLTACKPIDHTQYSSVFTHIEGGRLYIESGECVDSNGNDVPDSMEYLLDHAKQENWMLSFYWDQECHYASTSKNNRWKIAYIK